MRPIRTLDPLPQGGFRQIEIASGRADCLPLIEDQAHRAGFEDPQRPAICPS